MTEATISPAAKSGMAAGFGVGSLLADGAGMDGRGVGVTVGVGVGVGRGVGDSSAGSVHAATTTTTTAAADALRPPIDLIGKSLARQSPVSCGMLAARRSAISRAFVVP
jgi:hypothetical protein